MAWSLPIWESTAALVADATSPSTLTAKIAPNFVSFSINNLFYFIVLAWRNSNFYRPHSEPANATANCPRQNGYFAHSDPTVCDQFFFCSSGQGVLAERKLFDSIITEPLSYLLIFFTANLITCPGGLVFNPNTGTCSWPGEANRAGCQSKGIHTAFFPPRFPFERNNNVKHILVQTSLLLIAPPEFLRLIPSDPSSSTLCTLILLIASTSTFASEERNLAATVAPLVWFSTTWPSVVTGRGTSPTGAYLIFN